IFTENPVNGCTRRECWCTPLPCSAPRPMIFYCALCPFPFCPASVPKHIRNTWQSACKSRPEGLPLQKVIAHYNP
ncbi:MULTISPECIES: hypothetical protein, partial [Bacteroidaceae]